MTSPLKSWCYNCNAYHNPDVKFRWAKKHADSNQKKFPEVEFLATCPRCGVKMLPDNKIMKLAGLMAHQLELEILKAKRQQQHS